MASVNNSSNSSVWQEISTDFSGDQRVFQLSWGKTMMWMFLLGDVFVFSCLLISYMSVRITTTAEWPNSADVFSLTIGTQTVPLLLIAIMTFILITSSGTMAIAVNYAFQDKLRRSQFLILATALLGLSFVGMQALEWSKLIHEGVRPWSNPMGASQFGACFFLITGFHGLHVSIGVIYLLLLAKKLSNNHRQKPENRLSANAVEIAGLYWHFVDLVWVFIFALFYLW
ncbi:MAG: cytochrome c oxidase subunit 3 [Pseudomonadales bacterium]|nr:cytochrome c oxidase subunit 3 [Pseudomonadales bacterium]